MSRTPLALVSAGNLLVNLLFPVLAIRALGASHAADALFLVFILPTVITVLLGNSVLNWATPRLVRRADSAARRQLAWSLLWSLLAGIFLLGGLLWLLALAVRQQVAADGSYALAIGLLPVGIAAMLVAVLTAVAQSLYTAERAVLSGEARALVGNLLATVAWFAVQPQTLLACALLFLLRAALTALLLSPRLGRSRAVDTADTDLREILRDSRALLLAASCYKSEPFVDRLLFASVSAGAVSAFHLAHQVLATVTQLMNRMVTATLIAPLSERVHRADAAGARRLLSRALRQMAVVGVLVWLSFWVLGEPLVRLLLGNTVDPQQTTLAAHMLLWLGGYLLGVLLGQVLAQTFYTTGDTRTMMWASLAGYALGLLLKLLALHWFGVAGLALALSLSSLLNLGIYGVRLGPPFRR